MYHITKLTTNMHQNISLLYQDLNWLVFSAIPYWNFLLFRNCYLSTERVPWLNQVSVKSFRYLNHLCVCDSVNFTLFLLKSAALMLCDLCNVFCCFSWLIFIFFYHLQEKSFCQSAHYFPAVTLFTCANMILHEINGAFTTLSLLLLRD